jgi:hypothetical protein
MKQQIPFFLFVVLMINACTIVEIEDNQDSENGVITLTQGAIIGTGTIPTETSDFTNFLHGQGSKTWTAEEFSIEGMDGFLNCRLDDQVTLNSDGTYLYDGGERLCGAEDNQRIRTGIWSYNADSHELILEPGSDQEVIGTVKHLTNNELIITSRYESRLFGSFEVSGRYYVE